MNLDLLTKLVRLANNNPNENEANLAARKVCKMIEEGKFQFGAASKPQQGPVTWNDVRRSTEPAWRSAQQQSPPEYYSVYEQQFWAVMQEIERREKERKEKERKAGAPKPPQNPYSAPWGSGPAWDDNPFYRPYPGSKEEKKKPKKEKRPLACKRCKKSFMTGFVGPENQFQCNPCHWVEYNEERVEREKRSKVR